MYDLQAISRRELAVGATQRVNRGRQQIRWEFWMNWKIFVYGRYTQFCTTRHLCYVLNCRVILS